VIHERTLCANYHPQFCEGRKACNSCSSLSQLFGIVCVCDRCRNFVFEECRQRDGQMSSYKTVDGKCGSDFSNIN
jgi:hypothetical protein